MERDGLRGSVLRGEDLCGLLLVALVTLEETDLSSFGGKEQSVEALGVTELAEILVLSIAIKEEYLLTIWFGGLAIGRWLEPQG